MFGMVFLMKVLRIGAAHSRDRLLAISWVCHARFVAKLDSVDTITLVELCPWRCAVFVIREKGRFGSGVFHVSHAGTRRRSSLRNGMVHF